MRGVHRRREILRAGAAMAALAALPGCDAVVRGLAGAVDPLPDRIGLPSGRDVDPVFHLLSRAGFGPRPGEWDRARRIGADAWIEEQLAPERIDDRACDLRVAECELWRDPPQDLASVPGRLVERDLARVALIRAVHSRRQLFEALVGFWSDHLSVDTGKGGCCQAKPWDDREVVRRHAMGRFRDLVRASALSPAMLVYLDGRENRRRTPQERPNENYARELLELHTLGVRGGYTQRDVMEVARCLTGWTLEDRNLLRRDEVVFRPADHDDGEKVVLGVRIPAGGGERDLERVLDVVCAHPSTARHVAAKLCRRFVADEPPAGLVDGVARVFARTAGDVRAVVGHVLRSEEFRASAGRKLKRPFHFAASALRVVGAECRAGPQELDFLARTGHVPFQCPTPDGYPDEAGPWTGALLWRWDFALALAANRLDGTRSDLPALARRAGVDFDRGAPSGLAPLLFGRAARPEESRAVADYVARSGGAPADRRSEAFALLLCAPAFQVH